MIDFDSGEILRALPALGRGLIFTLQLTVVASVGGMLCGLLLALGRQAPWTALRVFCAGYVNLMRAVPLILAIFWIYFLIPLLIGHPIVASQTAYLTFTVFEAAYFCEIIRAGLRAIPPGQAQAAASLGLTTGQGLRYIILPQALRHMLPVLLTQVIVLLQDTSLVYVLDLPDLLGMASKIAQRDSRLLELYSSAALIYFLLSFTLSRLAHQLGRHLAVQP